MKVITKKRIQIGEDLNIAHMRKNYTNTNDEPESFDDDRATLFYR
jgi:hypothetical protein